MKKDKFDVKEIKVMAQLYELLEKDALLLTRDHKLLDVLVDYRNQTENTNEKQLAQWELESFLYGFHGIDFCLQHLNRRGTGYLQRVS